MKNISGSMSISSLETLHVKKTSHGQWRIILDDLVYTVSEFLNLTSHNSFQLNELKNGTLSALEKEAMFLFVNGGDYTVYNNLLRQGGLNSLDHKVLKKTLVRIALMQSGINRLPDYIGNVYRVASCNDSTSIYNGIADGSLSVDAITTTNTFVGACRLGFVTVEHAPIVIWTVIKTLHAKVQPASLEEVTFPLGTQIKFTNINQLNPRKIIGHIDPDAKLKWAQIGSKLRPFIGLNLYYEDQKLPDFYFLSEPRQFRRLALAPFTFFLERSNLFYKLYAQKELKHIKRLPAERRFQEMWTSRLDSSSKAGQLPEIIYLAEAEEMPSSVL
jgi:hypothetical protein